MYPGRAGKPSDTPPRSREPRLPNRLHCPRSGASGAKPAEGPEALGCRARRGVAGARHCDTAAPAQSRHPSERHARPPTPRREACSSPRGPGLPCQPLTRTGTTGPATPAGGPRAPRRSQSAQPRRPPGTLPEHAAAPASSPPPGAGGPATAAGEASSRPPTWPHLRPRLVPRRRRRATLRPRHPPWDGTKIPRSLACVGLLSRKPDLQQFLGPFEKMCSFHHRETSEQPTTTENQLN